MSLSWIWSDKITNERVARVGYNHFISNKGEWNNCFSKFSNRVLPPIFTSTILQSVRKENLAHYFPYDVKLGLLAHSRSFLANQKARNAIVGAENLLKADKPRGMLVEPFWPYGHFKEIFKFIHHCSLFVRVLSESWRHSRPALLIPSWVRFGLIRHVGESSRFRKTQESLEIKHHPVAWFSSRGRLERLQTRLQSPREPST